MPQRGQVGSSERRSLERIVVDGEVVEELAPLHGGGLGNVSAIDRLRIKQMIFAVGKGAPFTGPEDTFPLWLRTFISAIYQVFPGYARALEIVQMSGANDASYFTVEEALVADGFGFTLPEVSTHLYHMVNTTLQTGKAALTVHRMFMQYPNDGLKIFAAVCDAYEALNSRHVNVLQRELSSLVFDPVNPHAFLAAYGDIVARMDLAQVPIPEAVQVAFIVGHLESCEVTVWQDAGFSLEETGTMEAVVKKITTVAKRLEAQVQREQASQLSALRPIQGLAVRPSAPSRALAVPGVGGGRLVHLHFQPGGPGCVFHGPTANHVSHECIFIRGRPTAVGATGRGSGRSSGGAGGRSVGAHQGGRGRERVCYNCGQGGHVSHNCPSRHPSTLPSSVPDSDDLQVSAGVSAITLDNGLFEDLYSATPPTESLLSCAVGSAPFPSPLVDSGCLASHVFDSAAGLVNLRPRTGSVMGVGQQVTQITMTGDLECSVGLADGRRHNIRLKDICVAPGCGFTLLSLERLTAGGTQAVFGDGTLHSHSAYLLISGGTRKIPLVGSHGEGWRIDIGPPSVSASSSVVLAGVPNLPPSSEVDAGTTLLSPLWHRRLGHAGVKVSKEFATLLSGDESGALRHAITTTQPCCLDGAHCSVCRLSKAKQRSLITSRPRVSPRCVVPGERFHIDLAGPFSVLAYGSQAKFIGMFTCEASGRNFPFYLKRKDEMPRTLTKLYDICRRSGHTPRSLHGDRDSVFEGQSFQRAATELGMEVDTSGAYEPRQNGFAECQWGVLFPQTRCLLLQASAPVAFWALAFETAVYVKSLLPTQHLSRGFNPYMVWFNERRVPNASRLRVWGCAAWITLQPSQRVTAKWSPRAMEGMLVGYSETCPSWIIYVFEKATFVKSVHVMFDELVFPMALRQHFAPFALKSSITVEVLPPLLDDEPFLAPSRAMSRVCLDPVVSVVPLASEEPVVQDVPVRLAADGALESGSPLWALPFPIDLPASEEPEVLVPLPTVPSPPPPTPVSTRVRRLRPTSIPTCRITSSRVIVPPAAVPKPACAPRLPPAGLGDFIQHPVASATVHIGEHDPAPLFLRVCAACVLAPSPSVDPDSPTLKTALHGPRSQEWYAAYQTELSSLKAHGVMVEVPLASLPSDADILPTQVVLTTKRDEHGKFLKCKARLVALGNRLAREYTTAETYAAVASLTEVRIIAAAAVLHGCTLYSADVSTAFLNAALPATDAPIYVRLPQLRDPRHLLPGESVMNQRSFTVGRLYKALYGLPTSPKLWFSLLHKTLLKYGLQPCPKFPCIYVRFYSNGDKLMVAVYVDDMLLAVTSVALKTHFITFLSSEFALKDQGPVRQILSIEVHQTRQLVHLSSPQFIRDLVQEFGMLSAPHSIIPADSTKTLPTLTSPLSSEDAGVGDRFRTLVGKLLYLSTATRLDIAVAVRNLLRHNRSPGVVHLEAAYKVVRYLAGTVTLGITYSCLPLAAVPTTPVATPITPGQLVAYADANWADPQSSECRKSVQGLLVMLAGGAVSWKCKSTPVVALSSTESEFYTVSEAGREISYLLPLLEALHLPQPDPTPLFEDNSACITICESNRISDRIKHIDVKYFYIRELVAIGRIVLLKIHTSNQLADLLTKPLARILFHKLVGLVISPPPRP